MTRPYILSGDAEDDLHGIIEYTAKQWGAAQCRAYTSALEIKATEVALGQGTFKDMSSIMPGLRMATSGKHYIFCLPRQGQPALILAILHERMDLMARLQNRLKE